MPVGMGETYDHPWVADRPNKARNIHLMYCAIRNWGRGEEKLEKNIVFCVFYKKCISLLTDYQFDFRHLHIVRDETAMLKMRLLKI